MFSQDDVHWSYTLTTYLGTLFRYMIDRVLGGGNLMLRVYWASPCFRNRGFPTPHEGDKVAKALTLE